MNKLFFLLFFSLPAIYGEYELRLKSIERFFPENLQTTIYDKNKWANKARKAFNGFGAGHKDDYAFDITKQTAACGMANKDGQYQIAFYNGSSVFLPYRDNDTEKPLNFGINENIIFKLKKDYEFSVIAIPLNARDEYYALNLKEIQPVFNDDEQKIIQALKNNNKKVNCWASRNYGEFYLESDGQFYLFTIKNTPDNVKRKSKSSSFLTLNRLGLMGLVCAGIIFLIYFNLRTKNFFK